MEESEMKVVCVFKDCRLLMQAGPDKNLSHGYCPACTAREQWVDGGFTQEEIIEFDAELDQRVVARGEKPRVLLVGNDGLRVREALEAAALAERRVPNVLVLDAPERERSRRVSGYPMPALANLAMASTYLRHWPQSKGPFLPEPPKPIKKCLQCGEEHRHNNSFCSVGCCKEYKNGKRVLREMSKIKRGE